MRGYGFITEAVFVQHLIQDNAGMVTSEGSAGGISAVHSGRESDNKQFWFINAKSRYGSCMVVAIFCARFFKKTAQPWAFSTVKIKNRKIFRHATILRYQSRFVGISVLFLSCLCVELAS